PGAQDRALANGAMAQTGNIGNTLGTPVLFALASLGGHGVMMATLCALLLAGAAAHWGLHLARRAA
ncbi:MFS transporter, partial [Vibrio sp. 404]|nr:MFS transporter [Vibrio marinisediminis]